MVSNKCIEEHKRKKKKCWVVLLDLEKAYARLIGIFWTLCCSRRDSIQSGENGYMHVFPLVIFLSFVNGSPKGSFLHLGVSDRVTLVTVSLDFSGGFSSR